MDNQNTQPPAPDQPTANQSAMPQAQTIPLTNDPNKPTPSIPISDAEAQSILIVNDLLVGHRSPPRVPVKLLMVVAVLIVLAILASSLLGAAKSKDSAKSTSSGSVPGTSNSSDAGSGSGTSNEVNQDVKACSNPVNALTEC
jgi:hypothetical protein